MALNIAAVVATIGWVVVGWLAVRRERRGLMLAFFCLAIIEPIYVVLKLYAMASDSSTSYPESTFQQFYITAALALCVRGYLLVYGLRCLINFGRGLRERVFDRIARRQADERRAAERRRRRARERKFVSARTESADSHTAPRLVVREGEPVRWKAATNSAALALPEKKEVNGSAAASLASNSGNGVGVASSPSSGGVVNGGSSVHGALSGVSLDKKKKIVKKKNPGSVPSQHTLIAYEDSASDDEFEQNANEWDGGHNHDNDERKATEAQVYADYRYEEAENGNASASENSLRKPSDSIDSFARTHIQSIGSGEDI